MPEDVVYSDVRFNKKHQSGNGTVSPNQDEVTYSQVRLGAPKSTVGGSSQDEDVTYSQITIGQAQRTHKTTESASQKEEEEVTYSEVRRAPQPVRTSAEKPNRTKCLVIGVVTAVLVLAVIAVVLVMILSGKGSKSEPQQQTPPPVPTTEAPTTEAPTTEAPTTEAPTTEAPGTSPTPKAPVCTDRLQCDPGWELHEDKCYNFSQNMDKRSWNESRKACQLLNADLVKIDNTEEQFFVFDKLLKLMNENEDKFWIGLTDSKTEGQWKWTDESALNTSLSFWFKNGKTKEPDDWKDSGQYPEGEDCVRMGEKSEWFKDKCWFDQHCRLENRFICEKQATKYCN